ncbi:sigma-54-dependent transcriptional regulator [Wenzhouxiangella marina]|uniref:Type 4 fimbriae expression regulatory protein PilR n=1 Tax=Wenzhouxiangella marina TaxID=1579979 RepID=A0A0K0XXC8_9GAMM|nr:sigma-54 dependent transcriptional regulator [Wenzhouxiangella marina]AKS42338.1 Type 4 fimbriae expression regulatory protein PilR [Wenzhouxiangella marina]MBB6085889.1 two-component system response regulator PilR (NtrC family) [Wenzhouxiangella marina]
MTQMRALVVDDEPDLRELLDITLSRMGLEVDTAEDLSEARRLLASGADYALCLTDMRLPDGNGLTLIKEINRDHEQIPVAMITAFGKVEDAVTALKYGAFDFVSKPVDLEVLRNLIRTALKLRKDDAETSPSPERTDSQRRAEPAPSPADVERAEGSKDDKSYLLQRLIGQSEAIKRVRQTIVKLARSQAPVLISGESGTGKELAARLIHDLGPRAEEPFIAVNCGAIPTELMESEFFGHVKGSFTGADSDKEGLFQAAQGGTLFLDEVADLPLPMQVKLLRVIQEKTVRPIGGRQEIKIDVRILSASHKPLKPLVDEGAFRNDLYYRLNVIELQMPALSERRDDIIILAEHFLQSIGEQWGEPARTLGEGARKALRGHAFSGNVRELVNILQRAVTMCEGDEITPEDLSLDGEQAGDDAMFADRPEDRSLDDYIEDVEKHILENALREARFNKTEAARQLGITFRSLRYKLKKYGID